MEESQHIPPRQGVDPMSVRSAPASAGHDAVICLWFLVA